MAKFVWKMVYGQLNFSVTILEPERASHSLVFNKIMVGSSCSWKFTSNTENLIWPWLDHLTYVVVFNCFMWCWFDKQCGSVHKRERGSNGEKSTNEWSRKGRKKTKKFCKNEDRISDASPPAHLYWHFYISLIFWLMYM